VHETGRKEKGMFSRYSSDKLPVTAHSIGFLLLSKQSWKFIANEIGVFKFSFICMLPQEEHLLRFLILYFSYFQTLSS